MMEPIVEIHINEPTNGGQLEGQRVLFVIKTDVGAKWLLPFVSGAMGAGADVLVVLPAGDGDLSDRLAAAGVDVVRTAALGSSPWKAVLHLGEFRRLIDNFRPTVINYYLYRSAMLCRLATARIKATRVHSVVGPLFYESRLIRPVERYLSRRDHFLFAGSEAVARAAIGVGFPGSRVRVVRCGADFEQFTPPAESRRLTSRSQFAISQESPVFVMVAYWYGIKRLALGGTDLKGHDTAIEAWLNYKSRGGAGQLLVVGGGFGRRGEAYRSEMIDRYCLHEVDSIVLCGTIDNVSAAYDCADVSIAPSRSENYGSTIEAAAMAIPTLGAEVGGIPEVVIDGETGWLFPAGDVEAMDKALERAADAVTTGAAKKMGARARDQIRAKFDWSQITAEYVRHLSSVSSDEGQLR